jgi:hypothetical protein
MKQILDQFLQFVQQGIAAVFRFIQLVWAWSIDQITKMMQAPFEHWPLWKQILLIVVILAVAYALFIAARQLWAAAIHVLASFARFVGALVYTLPAILIAGCIAVAGLWVINNLDLSSVDRVVFERSKTESSNNGGSTQSRQTTGQSRSEATGSRP